MGSKKQGPVIFLMTVLAVLTLVSAWLFCAGINQIPTLDRDEALYVQASKQMLARQDWFQINFQEEPRHLKPPGIYWLQAGMVKITTGPESTLMWPYRLVSVLGAWVAVLGVFLFWRRSLGDAVACLAACFLATSFLLNIEVHIANTDSVLLACMVLMQGALWKLYEAHGLNLKITPRFEIGYSALFWAAMAFGILIKGITPLVGLLTLLFIFMFDRSVSFGSKIRPVGGICGVVLFTALWLVPLCRAGHSNFLWDMIHGDVLPKLAGGQESHGQWPGYFLVLSPIFLFPASLLLPQGIKLAWVDRRKIPIRFLLAWIMPVWVFFEFVPTKLPQYVMPVFPAIFLIFSLALLRVITIQSGWKYLAKCYQILWLFCGIFLASVLIIFPHRIEGVYNLWSYVAAGILILGSVMAWFGIKLNKLKIILMGLSLSGLLVWPIVFFKIMPEMSNFWLTDKLVTHLKREGLFDQISPRTPLLITGYNEPSVVFNLGTESVHEVDLADLANLMKTTSFSTAVLLDSQLPEFYRLTKSLNLKFHIVDEIEGFRYNGGHWQTLVILESGL